MDRIDEIRSLVGDRTIEDVVRKVFNGKLPILEMCLHVTYACNLRCKHCAVSASTPLPGEMNTREIKNLIDQAVELGLLRLAISGGEPFIRKDMLEILRYADDKIGENGGGITIPTNATLITQEIITGLKMLNNLWVLGVSLDGVESTHDFIRGKGVYAKTVETIKRLIKNGIPVSLEFVFNKYNKNQIYDIAELALSLKVPVIRYLPVECMGRAKKFGLELNALEIYQTLQQVWDVHRKLKGKLDVYANSPPCLIPPDVLKGTRHLEGCAVGVILCEVLPDGTIVPCHAFGGFSEFRTGNVRKDKLSQVWKNSPILEKMRKELRPRDLKGVCGICVFKDTCFGYCRVNAYLEYGDFLGPYPTCQELYNHGMFPKEYLEK